MQGAGFGDPDGGACDVLRACFPLEGALRSVRCALITPQEDATERGTPELLRKAAGTWDERAAVRGVFGGN